MIVPKFWAEGKVRHREKGKQITVRRFGWSDTSQEDAQTGADQRAEAALQQLIAGKRLPRSEPKIPYNGAEGVPIREEILDRRGETVITRNSYGAHCLNTADVFFADVDFKESSPSRPIMAIWLIMAAAAILVGQSLGGGAGALAAGGIIVAAAFAAGPVGKWIQRRIGTSPEKAEKQAMDRIRHFISLKPDWNFRIYRTPAGLRILATHRTFSPRDPEVAVCFKALGTDTIYRNMCVRQNCFRARVSPKPWRVGIGDHMKPRPGTWPVNPDRLPMRNAWIARYETMALSFASCRLVETLGSGVTDQEVLPIQVWHDELSRALSQLPIA